MFDGTLFHWDSCGSVVEYASYGSFVLVLESHMVNPFVVKITIGQLMNANDVIDNKQLLDEVFVLSGIIMVEVSVIS